MTAKEAVIWLINISADIGKAEYRSLWHYEQALDGIRDLLESMPIEPEPSQIARDIATIIQNEKDMRVMRKKGKWIIDHLVSTGGGTYQVLRCDRCDHTEPWQMARNFCPNCGADMRQKGE